MEKAIELYGDSGNVWNRIADIVKTRNSTQCRERYRNVLAGNHLIRAWTDEESSRLFQYCEQKIQQGCYTIQFVTSYVLQCRQIYTLE